MEITFIETFLFSFLSSSCSLISELSVIIAISSSPNFFHLFLTQNLVVLWPKRFQKSSWLVALFYWLFFNSTNTIQLICLGAYQSTGSRQLKELLRVFSECLDFSSNQAPEALIFLQGEKVLSIYGSDDFEFYRREEIPVIGVWVDIVFVGGDVYKTNPKLFSHYGNPKKVDRYTVLYLLK